MGTKTRSLWVLGTMFFFLVGMLILSGPVPAFAAKKVVHIWHTEPNPKTVGVMKEIIADFEKLHPDIKIEQEPISWGDLGAKLMAAVAAGAPPDASHGQTYMERSFSAKGLLVPIDDVYQSIGEDDIFDVVKRLDYHDGHYYGIAHAIGVDTLIYRKDIFDAKGLKHPKTWDEWLKVLEALTEDIDGDGVIDRYGLGLAGLGFFINEEVYMWVGSNGGRLFDEKGRPTFTEKPVLEVLAFWKKLQDRKVVPPGWLGHDYLDTFTELAVGKVAMILGWGRGVGFFEQYAPDIADGDHFNVMWKPIGPSGTKVLTQLDCEPWMVFKDAKYPNEAKEFLKFFYQKDNYLKYIQTVPVHFFPIRKSVREDPRYKATPLIKEWKFWTDQQHEYISRGLAQPLLMTEWDDLELPFINEIAESGILMDMVTDVLKKDKDPLRAAIDAQKKAEKLIEKLGYKKW